MAATASLSMLTCGHVASSTAFSEKSVFLGSRLAGGVPSLPARRVHPRKENVLAMAFHKNTEDDNGSEARGPSVALVGLLAAGLLLSAPVDDAFAAQSSGRVGGSSFRRNAPPPSASTNKTVIVQSGPTIIAPPIYSPPFFGGWGWSPFYSPAPVVAVGVGGGGGFLSFVFFMGFAAVLFAVVSSLFGRKDDDRY